MEPANQNLTARIDLNKCVGSTMCIQFVPDGFALTERKQAKVIAGPGFPAAKLREAAEQCPMSAIILEDAATGQRVFP